ncbi:unnamed protein product, partial [Cyprideis torosa]
MAPPTPQQQPPGGYGAGPPQPSPYMGQQQGQYPQGHFPRQAHPQSPHMQEQQQPRYPPMHHPQGVSPNSPFGHGVRGQNSPLGVGQVVSPR